jgi:hypothetical protein
VMAEDPQQFQAALADARDDVQARTPKSSARLGAG